MTDTPTFSPLGDQAVLAYFPDESTAIHFASAVRVAAPTWLVDVVPAYASVGVFFDADRLPIAEVIDSLRNVKLPESTGNSAISTVHTIPVCYEMQHD